VQPTDSYTLVPLEIAGSRQQLLTTREVATMLGLSPATVLRRWRAGELPGYRLGSNVLRFSEADIAAWLEGRRSQNADGARVR
jgi:excisionase family DNA binding protein